MFGLGYPSSKKWEIILSWRLWCYQKLHYDSKKCYGKNYLQVASMKYIRIWTNVISEYRSSAMETTMISEKNISSHIHIRMHMHTHTHTHAHVYIHTIHTSLSIYILEKKSYKDRKESHCGIRDTWLMMMYCFSGFNNGCYITAHSFNSVWNCLKNMAW